MKIVFMAPFGLRPKGTVLARMVPLAAELQRLGHQVCIIAPPYTNPGDSGTVELVQGVTVRNIRLGPRHKILAVPVLAWRMFREALREKPDLLHLFKPKGYGGVAGMLLLMFKSLGICVPPLFLDMDDWEGAGGMNELHDYSPVEKRFYRFQEQWLSRRVAGITVASRALQALVREMGIQEVRTLYLPNCVRETQPVDARDARRRLGIADSAPVLLLYTRFFEFSQERLHQVFSEVYRLVPGVRFLVVGRGRQGEERQLLEAAAAGGFGGALVMAGWVEPADLPEVLAIGDVSVYPLDDTLLNRCKCPAKLTELLAFGMAVVADRVGQASEYVNPAAPDMLCRPGDWKQMAERAAKLLQNPDICREVGQSNRKYLLEHFTWNRYADKLNTLYGEYKTQ
jgi:glycosyltransferase involved in cell wall biosynthesis